MHCANSSQQLGGCFLQVFVIDDDLTISHAMEQVLKPFRFGLTRLSSTSEVEAALKHEAPDLVFLDYRLGNENGLTLIPTLLKENQYRYAMTIIPGKVRIPMEKNPNPLQLPRTMLTRSTARSVISAL
ncbi:response regulator [bacterium]|nr:response regulator [bacterium]